MGGKVDRIGLGLRRVRATRRGGSGGILRLDGLFSRACATMGRLCSTIAAAICLLIVVSAPTAVFAAPLPIIDSVTPNSGPVEGGTTVDIEGGHFTGTTGVYFGAHSAAFEVKNDSLIVATTPAGTAGSVTVGVFTPGGNFGLGDAFTYVGESADAVPDITSVSPDSGPVAGGTVVTIHGSGFSGVTNVDFGLNAATSFTIVNATTIRATTPPGLAARRMCSSRQ